MAKYPIKMLKDEEGTPFVPLVSTEALRTPEGETIEEKLEKKLEPSNLIAGTDITLSVDGNNITINNASKGVLIDNLDTETSGLGSLDAHQGKVLKDMIPDVVDNLTTVSTDKALSAYQGYLLNHKVVPTGGTTGQVLKKSSNDDHALEWGDAADPNAIVGDGSIKKIIELTYEEYQALDTIDPDTEYHILDAQSGINNLEEFVANLILESDKRKHPIGSLEFNTSGTNPASYLGFGTWTLWGAGKVPIGVDTSDSTINKADLSVGSKTVKYKPAGTNKGTAVTLNAISLSHSGGAVQSHTLTVNEMPPHNHGLKEPFYKFAELSMGLVGQVYKGEKRQDNTWYSEKTGGGQGHSHRFTQPSAHSFTPTTKSITQPTFTGTEATINVQQPSISCYMWKRTA